MDDLSRILEELEKSYITKDQAEKRVLDLFSVSNLLPNHVVKFRLEELEMKYQYLMEQLEKLQ
jgi:hypothetical protein